MMFSMLPKRDSIKYKVIKSISI